MYMGKLNHVPVEPQILCCSLEQARFESLFLPPYMLPSQRVIICSVHVSADNLCFPDLLCSNRYHVKKCRVCIIKLKAVMTMQAQQQYQVPRPMVPEVPAPPNSLLFVQNLPHEAASLAIQMLFQQFPGFKEVRMIEAKPGIAFVEFGDEMQASVALSALQNFKITPSHPMIVSYAKK